MANDPEFHPVYRVLIQRPHWFGVDQRFIFIGPILMLGITLVGLVALGGWFAPWALLLGLVAMATSHLACRWMYTHEPNLPLMLWRAWGQKGRYDPLKHDPVYVEVRTS